MRYFEGELEPDSPARPASWSRAVHRIMTHADARRRLGVRANADNRPDAARARRFGAEGIGLVRTEHMFLGERRQLVERLILAETDEDAPGRAGRAASRCSAATSSEILTAMDGLPVTIRLDRPAAARVPARPDRPVGQGRPGRATGQPTRSAELLAAVRRMHEQNPMLGLRGVRLGLVIPGLFAHAGARDRDAAAAAQAGRQRPAPEIMIPLVAAVQELEIARELTEQVLGRGRGGDRRPPATSRSAR